MSSQIFLALRLRPAEARSSTTLATFACSPWNLLEDEGAAPQALSPVAGARGAREAGGVPGRDVLGAADTGLRRPGGARADPRARARGARRQPDGPDLTGDRSGDFLFASLFRTGFSNQAESISRDDG